MGRATVVSVHLLLTTPMEEMLAEVNFSFSLLWQLLNLKNFSSPGSVLISLMNILVPAELQNVSFLRTNIHLGYRFLYAIVNP